MYKYHILSGLNKENCTILNCLFKPETKTDWKMGSTFNSSNAFGSLPFDITLSDNEITIRIKNIVINDGTNPSIIPLTLNYDYKIILMKIPEYIKNADYVLGDVNKDGQITEEDANMCLQFSTGNIALTEQQFKAADVDKNGEVDARDSLRIKKHINEGY